MTVAVRNLTWVLVSTQVVLVAAYTYGAVARISTREVSFPEQAPPGWAWPAVIATGIGPCLAALCLIVAVPLLRGEGLRTRPAQRQWLLGATVATGVALAVMVTPPGWEIFDWYVS